MACIKQPPITSPSRGRRAVPADADPYPREAQVLLECLVRIQKPASYYATTVVRDAGRPEVHLAFEDKGDAQKLADAVEAEATATTQAGRPNGPSIWTARRWQRWPLRFHCRRRAQTTASRTTSISPRRTRGKNSDHALRLIGKQSAGGAG
jgi:hypothetical protein